LPDGFQVENSENEVLITVKVTLQYRCSIATIELNVGIKTTN